MVNLELSVIDALAIESLLCMLDSHIHIKLGCEFKATYALYLAALSKVGISKVVGESLALLDILNFDVYGN